MAVRNRFDAGHRRTAVGEGMKEHEETDAAHACRLKRPRRVRKMADHGSRRCDDQQDDDAGDEEVGWNGEHPSRFAHSSQVTPPNDGDEDHGQRDPVLADGGGGGHDSGDPGGDAHRYGEHVVDQQGCCRDQPRDYPQVVLGDDVGTTPLRIRMDRLAVRKGDDDEQHRNQERQRSCRADSQQTGGNQNREHRIARVRY
jgi:hypothetical protein